jgi:hypothetical protein
VYSKGFEICTAGLEFESGRAPLVRAWDSRGFTPSPGPTKCAFRGGEVSSNPKKKKKVMCIAHIYKFVYFFLVVEINKSWN